MEQIVTKAPRGNVLSSALRWPVRHPKSTLIAAILLGFILLNVLAYHHVWSMTHFLPAGTRTPNPESLSRLQKIMVSLSGVAIPKPTNERNPQEFGLAFETDSFPGSDGVELEGWYVPHSKPRGMVLMVHGYADSKENLLPEAKALHDLGYAAYLLDCRGSGGSSGNRTTIGIDEADDVARALDRLETTAPIRPLILFGRSMGSAAILRAISVEGLRPDAVVLECPFDRLINTVESRFTMMGLPSFPAAQLLVFWGGVQCGFDGFAHNPADYAKHVKCPTLLLHGGNDPRVTVPQAQAISNNLPSGSRLEVFPDAGHESYLKRSPAEWTRIVGDFLSALSL